MQIDSIIPNPASPGSTVIIQGDDLGATERVFLGDQEASFDVDGEVLEVKVPDGAGTFDVIVEGRTAGANPSASPSRRADYRAPASAGCRAGRHGFDRRAFG